MIERKKIIAEQMVREYVRKRLVSKITETQRGEALLRSAIRSILQEAETGTEEPSTYTGINVLADLLKTIIPTIQDDYMMLTTSKEQRESFRNHLVHAVKNSLRPIEVTSDAEDLGENVVFEVDRATLTEKIEVEIKDEETEAEEFIDIEKEVEEDDFVKIDDQNETGRNFASETFKRIEKQTVDAYDMLADDQDRDMFYDYLITNLLLYFDKFEADLATTLPDVTTPEYEKEKAETEMEEDPVEDLDEPEPVEDTEEFDLDL